MQAGCINVTIDRPIDGSQLPSVPGDQCEGARDDEFRQHEKREFSALVVGRRSGDNQPDRDPSEDPQCCTAEDGTAWMSNRRS
jgi:hypothetical protein